MKKPYTTYEEDLRKTKVVEQFLDRYFYQGKQQRITNRKQQLAGIDVIFDNKKLDEKAAINYIKNQLETYSFELEFTDKYGVIRDGWLLDSKKENTHYLLIYITGNPKLENIEDITQINYILIRKDKIRELMNNIKLKKKLKYFKHKEKTIGLSQDLIYYTYNNVKYKLKLRRSRQLIEKPLNIIIPKSLLIELSEKTGKIPENIDKQTSKTIFQERMDSETIKAKTDEQKRLSKDRMEKIKRNNKILIKNKKHTKKTFLRNE